MLLRPIRIWIPAPPPPASNNKGEDEDTKELRLFLVKKFHWLHQLQLQALYQCKSQKTGLQSDYGSDDASVVVAAATANPHPWNWNAN